jgi:hypothetical protein
LPNELRIVESGTLHEPVPDGPFAVGHSPSVVVCPDGTLLAMYSSGSGKDSDDINLLLRRSADSGRTWSAATVPFDSTIDGVRGSLKAGHITSLPDRLVCAVMWIDREAFPGAPLFNPQTEGCLPMSVFVTESFDLGRTWASLRRVTVPADIGPASLTCPILALADGRLALSIESNKEFLDASPWMQRVVYLWSADRGQTWSDAVTICEDPTGRIANWDQRTGVAPDGRLTSFTWTYDFVTQTYHNIHRRISADGGLTWSDAVDIGVADQASVPAMLADGRVVLAWVDRFGSASIRARCGDSLDAPFPASTEVVIYDDRAADVPPPSADAGADATGTGEALVEMGVWTYGTPEAIALPDGTAYVVYYQGVPGAIGIRWARLAAAPR